MLVNESKASVVSPYCCLGGKVFTIFTTFTKREKGANFCVSTTLRICVQCTGGRIQRRDANGLSARDLRGGGGRVGWSDRVARNEPQTCAAPRFVVAGSRRRPAKTTTRKGMDLGSLFVCATWMLWSSDGWFREQQQHHHRHRSKSRCGCLRERAGGRAQISGLFHSAPVRQPASQPPPFHCPVVRSSLSLSSPLAIAGGGVVSCGGVGLSRNPRRSHTVILRSRYCCPLQAVKVQPQWRQQRRRRRH